MIRLRRQPNVLAAGHRGNWAPIVLVFGLIAAGVWLMILGRGTDFRFDEWTWILHRRGHGLDTFFQPHVDHLSTVPIFVYKVLLETVGLDHYWFYRLCLTGLILITAGLFFLVARRRTGDAPALVLALGLSILGTGAENLLWPFQISFVGPVTCALGMLLAFDRRDRTGDIIACVLILIALGSSGVGVAVLAGASVEVTLGKYRAKRSWIVLVPAVLFTVWTLIYGTATISLSALEAVPAFFFDIAADTTSKLMGLQPEWGAPLFVLLVVAVMARILKGPLPPRFWAILTMPVAYWVVIGLGRGELEARYFYPGAILLVLLLAQLIERGSFQRRALGALLVAVLVANLGSLSDIRRTSSQLAGNGQHVRLHLGVLELARGSTNPDFNPGGFSGIDIDSAGAYFAATSDFGGTPAAALSEILREPSEALRGADIALTKALGIQLKTVPRPTVASLVPPVKDRGARVLARSGCITVTPSESFAERELTYPRGGLVIHRSSSPVRVKLRRFADDYSDHELTPPLRARAWGLLRIPRDRAPQSWKVSVEAPNPVEVCNGGAVGPGPRG